MILNAIIDTLFLKVGIDNDRLFFGKHEGRCESRMSDPRTVRGASPPEAEYRRGSMIKRFTVLLAVLILTAPVCAAAKKMYVTEITKITLRKGGGVDHRIIAMLSSGQELEVLETGPDWTLVRTPEGREGYVLTRFITDQPPSVVTLDKLQKAHAALLTRESALDQENRTLKSENERLSSELETAQSSLEETSRAYEALKKESADFFKLKKQYETAAATLAGQQEKADRLEKELAKARTNQAVIWGLSGAGVLFVGIIMGYSFRRKRRRSSLM